MKPLKDRKTLLSSKRKLIAMVNLYEKYIDEPIVAIYPEQGTIQSNKNKYSVDIKNNKVEKLSPDWADD